MKRRIAIIPARGGSKRIPRKNIKLFLGKPILAYSIEAALKSDLFHTVMVSTDDEEIRDIAKQYGAEVPFLRSDENANDVATTFDVIQEVLEVYQKQNTHFDYGCCIYPTAPFVTESMLDRTYKLLKEKGFVTVMPLIKNSFPIQRSLRINDNKVAMFYPEHENSRSQDLEPTYHDPGQFYWFDVVGLLKEQKLWTLKTGGLIISEMDAHDIDNIEDWSIAEFKYKLKHGIQA